MKDPISQFVGAWQKFDEGASRLATDIDWKRRFRDAEYYGVNLSETNFNHRELHAWCIEKFGDDHYAWTESIFWFDNPKNATWFALKWS